MLIGLLPSLFLAACGTEPGEDIFAHVAGGFEAEGARFDGQGARFGERLQFGTPGGAWRVDGARIQRLSGATTEWWEGENSTWEHGFDVASGDTEVVVDIPVPGVRLRDAGDTIHIQMPGTPGYTYDKLVAWDDRGRRLPADLGVVGQNIRLLVDTRGATFPVHIDPTLTPGQWIAAPVSGKYFGYALATGDLDGDGYTDAVVGYSSYTQLSVFMGSASGLPDTQSGAVTAAGTNTKLAGVGDVDGDGFDDVVEWASGTTLTVHYGSVDGLVSAATSTVTVSTTNAPTVAAAGDVNGDGYDDVLVGQPGWEDAQTNEGRVMLYLGSASGLSTTATWTWDSDVASLGVGSIMTTGDYNGDGRPDIAVGAAAYTNVETKEGAVFVFFGGSTVASAPDLTLEGGVANNAAGTALTTVPDLDGDGDDELLVQFYQTGSSPSTCGAYLQHGGATGIPTTPEASPISLECGDYNRIDAAGDYDGDGTADLLFVEPSSSAGGNNQEGRARIYAGSSAGFETSPMLTAYGVSAESYLGWSSGIGDFDADGTSDALLGAYHFNSNTGRLLAVYGDTEAVLGPATYSDLLMATSSEPGLGRLVTGGGDVEGDGYGDLVVARTSQTTYIYPGSATDLGTPDTVGGTSSSVGTRGIAVADLDLDGYSDVLVGGEASPDGTPGAAVSVYKGAATGIGDVGWSLRPDSSDSGFGSTMAVGDFNDDGWPDVVIGASGTSWGYTSEGSVSLFLGSATGPSSSPDWYWDADESYADAGTAVAAADFDGDGVDDFAVGTPGHQSYENTEGAVFVFAGKPGGPGLTPDWTVSCTHPTEGCGQALAAGDLDSDGFADLMVGAPGYDSATDDDVGAIHIYRGTSEGLGDDPSWDFIGDRSNSEYGEVLALGDVDADGDLDLAFGAPKYLSFSSNDGRAWLVANLGGSFGEPAWLASFEPSAHFGSSIAIADVDADGSGELFVTAPDAEGCLSCSPTTMGRVYRWDLEDGDGDGDFSISDCDDADPSQHAGAAEACDGIDNNCDGDVDEPTTWYRDADGDGHGTSATTSASCAMPSGYAADADDCDDADSSVSPGATEACDEVDNDCDGTIDESGSGESAWYTDRDGDAFGDDDTLVFSCTAPSGAVSVGGDCDDDDAGETNGTTFYADDDGDGYGDAASSVSACSAPVAYVTDATDCDDYRSSSHPDAAEACNGQDDDCDGTTDEGVTLTWHADADADSYGDPAVTTEACEAPYGYVDDATDCNDTSSSVSPARAELCDEVDNDCDGSADEGVEPTWYSDSDGDGWGGTTTTMACAAPVGFVATIGDCDDGEAAVHPGATESCNSLDDDCDSTVDEGATGTWYADADADGYGDVANPAASCEAAAGYVDNASDCDDTNGDVHPGTSELCNLIDEDCDGNVDENPIDAPSWYADGDGDGFGAGDANSACDAPDSYVVEDGDCDDTDATVNPAAAELSYDGIDQDCDGLADDDDQDGDGYAQADDCDDTDATIHPDAAEVWYDGVDQDCAAGDDFDADGDGQQSASYDGSDCDDSDATVYDGAPDEPYDGVMSDCGSTTDYDADQDGHDATFAGGDDCDDARSDTYPGASEVWYDGVDQDCDGNDADQDLDGFALPYDCDDTDAAINPAATEVLDNEVDEDCDGHAQVTEASEPEPEPKDTADTGSGGSDPGCGCAAAPATTGWALGFAIVTLAGLRRRHNAR